MMPLTTSKNKPGHKWQFEAIGTRWSIETATALGKTQSAVAQLIENYDRTYSRFRDDSLVAELAGKAGEYVFPDTAEPLIAFYRQLHDLTGGAVTPLVGDLLAVAGYDRSYSLKPGPAGSVPEWDDAMEWDGAGVKTKRLLTLDFGAAGKGHLVDLIGDLLENAGHTEYTIDASGDIRVRGRQQTIGLENPFDTSRVIGTIPLGNASLCASATNRRVWGDWHHIVDPRSGRPVTAIAATWVAAPTTMVADGLATALFFVAADTLSDWEFDYVRLLANGTVERSEGFVGELYI